MAVDVSKFGSKESKGTSVITRASGQREYYKDGKLTQIQSDQLGAKGEKITVKIEPTATAKPVYSSSKSGVGSTGISSQNVDKILEDKAKLEASLPKQTSFSFSAPIKATNLNAQNTQNVFSSFPKIDINTQNLMRQQADLSAYKMGQQTTSYTNENGLLYNPGQAIDTTLKATGSKGEDYFYMRSPEDISRRQFFEDTKNNLKQGVYTAIDFSGEGRNLLKKVGIDLNKKPTEFYSQSEVDKYANKQLFEDTLKGSQKTQGYNLIADNKGDYYLFTPKTLSNNDILIRDEAKFKEYGLNQFSDSLKEQSTLLKQTKNDIDKLSLEVASGSGDLNAYNQKVDAFNDLQTKFDLSSQTYDEKIKDLESKGIIQTKGFYYDKPLDLSKQKDINERFVSTQALSLGFFDAGEESRATGGAKLLSDVITNGENYFVGSGVAKAMLQPGSVGYWSTKIMGSAPVRLASEGWTGEVNDIVMGGLGQREEIVQAYKEGRSKDIPLILAYGYGKEKISDKLTGKGFGDVMTPANTKILFAQQSVGNTKSLGRLFEMEDPSKVSFMKDFSRTTGIDFSQPDLRVDKGVFADVNANIRNQIDFSNLKTKGNDFKISDTTIKSFKVNKQDKVDRTDTTQKLGIKEFKFNKLDKIDKIQKENKLDRLDRVDRVETKLDKLDRLDRVDRVETKLDKLDRLDRVDRVETKFDKIERFGFDFGFPGTPWNPLGLRGTGEGLGFGKKANESSFQNKIADLTKWNNQVSQNQAFNYRQKQQSRRVFNPSMMSQPDFFNNNSFGLPTHQLNSQGLSPSITKGRPSGFNSKNVNPWKTKVNEGFGKYGKMNRKSNSDLKNKIYG